jgi:D-sedoheptulose 7-phosphate isomerase
MSADNLKSSLKKRRELFDWLAADGMAVVTAIADGITHCLKNGGVVYACGNGGSASQAEHFVAELVGRFKKNRKPLPAFALSTNSSIMTAVSNDYGFTSVFARQLEGAAKSGDALVAISTSGDSENVVRACKMAKSLGMSVSALTGKRGGLVSTESDIILRVPDEEGDTARIQEIHLIGLHLICRLVEESIFSPSPAVTDDA